MAIQACVEEMNKKQVKNRFPVLTLLILSGFVVLCLFPATRAGAATTLSVTQTAPLTVEASWNNDDAHCHVGICKAIMLDWGDGTPHTIFAPPIDGTATHVYTRPGQYTVSITCDPVVPPAPVGCNIQVTLYVTGAYEVEARPRTADLIPSQSKTIPITYTLTGGGTFTATSTQGEILSSSGKVLYRIPRAVTILARNHRGSASETLTVPPGVVEQALRTNRLPLTFRRIFRSEGNGANAEVTLRVVPSSAGPFSLVRMELSFLHPDQEPSRGRMIKSSTPGRITVPRHTRDLKVLAKLTYNGTGMLRAQWRVDGQVLGFVSQHLPPGRRHVTLESPDTPPMPTFDTGRHRVELEILDPAVEFDEPIIDYYVVRDRNSELQKPIRLVSPTELARLPVHKDAFKGPLFRWGPLEGASVYVVELHNARTLGEGRNQPVLTARTRDTTYSLSSFDLLKLIPSTSYAWRVMAVDGDFVIGKSGSRAVSFYTADDSAKALRFEEVRVNGQGPDENGTGFHIHASDEYRVAVKLSNPGPKGLTGVRVEFLVQNRLMDVSFIPSMAPGEIQGIQGVLTLDQALPQKFVIRAVEVDSKGGELLTSSEGTLLPSH
jgi:hypothetical protein